MHVLCGHNACQFCLLPVLVYTTKCRQVTRAKSKSGAVVKHKRVLVVYETTSKVKWHFKSGTVPLYRPLVTSLKWAI